MKKKLLTIMCIATGYITTAQTISIPDPIFEQVLIDKEIDSDGIVNGMILTADAVSVTTLSITSPDEISGFYIQDLTGIEGFINLENLRVENTIIEGLNVSTLTKLKRLSCTGNMINALNVSNNTLLEYLIYHGAMMLALLIPLIALTLATTLTLKNFWHGAE